MKRASCTFFFIPLSVILLTQWQICNASPTYSSSKFFIKIETTNVDGAKLRVKPGDTLFVESGRRDHLRLINIHGDSLNYVTIINHNGLVEIDTETALFGIQIFDCSYFKFTGSGDQNLNYGIKINKTPAKSNGLSLDGLSTNYEIDHIEIAQTGFAGICANPKPDCYNRYNRGSFEQRNTIYHDNYIHKTYGEGFYIGHSFYTGYTINCNGKDTLIYPHEIKGLRVYNNILDSCGYDGIQVGCATADCEIYGNRIINYGFKNEKNQNFGIIIGGGTTGKCYNNFILNGSGNGINVFGLGNNTIYNNIIVNPGHSVSDSVQANAAYGIFCDDRSTVEGTSFNFINNTIIAPTSDGIRFYSTKSKNSLIANNLIVKPGSLGSYSTTNKSYVFYDNKVDLTVSNNYFSDNLPSTFNVENIDEIYQFCSGLPIINKGMDVSSFGINHDFNGGERVKDNQCDIGAFEFYYVEPEKQKSNSIKIIQQNSQGELMIYSTKNEKLERINIYQLSGQLLYSKKPTSIDSSVINTKNLLNNGIYLVCVETQSEECKNKIYISY